MHTRQEDEEWDVRAVVLFNRITTGCTLPLRLLDRRHRSKRFVLAGIPVYMVRGHGDHLLAWTALDDSIQLLERISPLWIGRMRSLFGCIMISARPDRSYYYLVDRCYTVNPWLITDNVENPASVPIILAGNLVYHLSHAMLIHGRFGLVGMRWFVALSTMAEVQFLRKVAAESCDFVAPGLIGALVRSKSFKIWRERRRLPMKVRYKGGVLYETGQQDE